MFTIGTALQTFVFVDQAVIERSMQLAGMNESEVVAAVPGFLRTWRLVGAAYIVGNAVGLLAPLGRTWVFWVVLVVNITQAAGVVVIPPPVITAMRESGGGAAYITTLIVDGGALILSLILLVSLVRFRAPWAQSRIAAAEV